MIDFSIFGWIYLIILLLWPFIIPTIFVIFRKTYRGQFWITSCVIGFVVYFTPVVLINFGVLDNFSIEIRDKLQDWKLSFPLITTIFLSYYWGKIVKPK